MPATPVNGIEIYYEQQGDPKAEPVLLIMGFAGNAGAWAPQITALAGRYFVTAFDNRGAGRTTQPEGAYTMAQMAADTVGLLDALGIGSAHVIAASMGGMIAQHVALRYPDRVRSLTLACTTPGGARSFGYERVQEISMELLDAEDLSALQTPENMQEAALRMFTPEFLKAPGPGFAQMIGSAIQWPSTLAGMKGQVHAILGHDTFDELPRITAPTLVITGADDELVDARNAPLLADRIPDAQLHVFAGLRHGFTAERPDEVNAVILEFLSRHAAADAAA